MKLIDNALLAMLEFYVMNATILIIMDLKDTLYVLNVQIHFLNILLNFCNIYLL
jgi:hypothetical protein